MNPRFTHYVYDPSCGVHVLAGDLVQCRGCEVFLYRDYAYVDDPQDETVRGEPTSEWGQIALGRVRIPKGADPAKPGQTLCEGCLIEAGLI